MTLSGSAWVRRTIPEIRSLDDVPVVTIFGAGVAGLSLAHELIERGFGVQVVEAAPHPDREYAIRIGGLAANQYGRIPAEPERLHPYLFSDDGRGAEDSLPSSERVVIVRLSSTTTTKKQWLVVDDHPPIELPTIPPTLAQIQAEVATLHGIEVVLDTANARLSIASKGPWKNRRLPVVTALEKNGAEFEPSKFVLVESANTLIELRAGRLKPVQTRYPIPERIQFERGAASWSDLIDDHGIPNSAKIQRIARALDAAYRDYEAALAAALAPNGPNAPLAEMLSDRMRRREAFCVEICGHTDGEDLPANNRTTSKGWATDVCAALEAELTSLGSPLANSFDHHCVAIGLGELAPIDNPRRARGRRACNRVEVRIVEHVIPGEHGYRYFPRFYRNLFDTMKRTPILDSDGRETGETAFDRLVPTRSVDLASKPPFDGPIPVPIRAPLSLEGLRALIERLLQRKELRVSTRDVLRFQAKMLRYATSCEARRREYEKQTWAEFVDLPKYDPAMSDLLNVTPEALVGMNGSETDARTQGTVLLQLLLDMAAMDEFTNATLSGPTSEAWLEDWKRYLARQGVRFFHGELTRLVWKGKKLLPLTTIARDRAHRVLLSVQDEGAIGCTIDGRTLSSVVPGGTDRIAHVEAEIEIGNQYKAERIGTLPILAVTRSTAGDPITVTTQGAGVRVVGVEPEIADQDYSAPTWFEKPLDGGPDFYVLAVPYLEASRLVWDADTHKPAHVAFDGCMAQLLRFDEESGRWETDSNGNKIKLRMEPERDGWGRPRDYEGRQWPLRDLSGVQFYFDRQSRVGTAHTYYLDATWGLSSISQIAYWRERRARESAFLGQLSVDLGRWYWHGEEIRTSAWRTARQRIAEEVWSQIESRLAVFPPRKDGDRPDRIQPAYYHLDEAIRFDDENGLRFSRAQVAISGTDPNPIALRVEGNPIQETSASQLGGAVETASGCAAILHQGLLLIGPKASGEETVVLVFDHAAPNATYRIRANGVTVESIAASHDAFLVAEDLEGKIKNSIPGLLAKATPATSNRPVQLRIQLDRTFSISAIAHDPSDADRVCIWMYPTGTVQVRPDPTRRTEYRNHLDATPARNAEPFLINAAGVCSAGTSLWSSRPGHALDPGETSTNTEHGSKGRIVYQPTRDRWLMVGNHMATWTRLSTMESANESARHAAAAIVHEVLTAKQPTGTSAPTTRSASRVVGDLPPVWNPEEHELEDAAPLKRLDERLAKEGLPHFMDILGVDEWIDGDPKAIVDLLQARDLGAKIKGLLSGSARGLAEDWSEIAEAVGNSLRALIGSQTGYGSTQGHGS